MPMLRNVNKSKKAKKQQNRKIPVKALGSGMLRGAAEALKKRKAALEKI